MRDTCMTSVPGFQAGVTRAVDTKISLLEGEARSVAWKWTPNASSYQNYVFKLWNGSSNMLFLWNKKSRFVDENLELRRSSPQTQAADSVFTSVLSRKVYVCLVTFAFLGKD